MKKKLYFSSLHVGVCTICALVFVFMSSCSEKPEPVEPVVGRQYAEKLYIDAMRDANLILVDYLELQEGERYVLNISREEAMELGVASEFYEKALEDVVNTNIFIEAARIRAIQDPEHCSVEITDPKAERLARSTFDLHPRPFGADPYNPFRGTLKTSGQERAEMYFPKSPLWLKGVRFYCLLNVMAGVITCRTYSFGIWKEKSVVGTIAYEKMVDVDVAAANVSIKVTFETNNSFGGIAPFEGLGWDGISGY